MDFSDRTPRRPAAGRASGLLSAGLSRKRGLSLCASAAALLWAGHASAQMAAPTMPVGDKKISIELRDVTTYDSNLARGTNLAATIKLLHPDDYLYQPGVRVDSLIPIGPAAVFLNGTAGYDFYQYNKNLEAGRADLLAGAQVRFGPCGGGLTAGYAAHQTDQGDLALQTTVNVQTVVTYGVQASCSEGRSLSENLSFQSATATNSATVGVIDSKQSGVSGGVAYTTKLVGSIGLQGGYTRLQYTTPDIHDIIQPGIKTYNVGLTFARPIGQRLNGSAALSYSLIHSDQTTLSDYSTWSGRGALSYRVNPRLTTSLTYSRAAIPTTQEGFGYSIQQLIQLDAAYKLTSRLNAGLGGSYDTRSYRNPTTPLPTELTHEDGNEIFGNINMSLARGASIALDLRRTVRNTNLTVFNYTAYRVGLTVAKRF